MNKHSIAYQSGKKAAERGIKLEDSAIRNLRPNTERYEQFIAGYESAKNTKGAA